MTTGIIDVGGGYRAIYGAGVLDACLDHKISFDRCYGISAGSGNLSSFLAGQNKRNYRFYVEYAFRSKYASLINLVRTGEFVGLDYAYGELSNSDGEYPLNFPALQANPASFTIVACNGLTGDPKYFDKSDLHQDDYAPIKASSTVPVANHAYMIDDVPYFDGGIVDPVPVQKAFDDGCDKVVLILTHERDFVREQKKDKAPAAILRRSYPAAAEKLENRYAIYNAEIELAKEYEAQGKLLIVAPEELYGLNTLSKTRNGLIKMYEEGKRDASAIAEFLA